MSYGCFVPLPQIGQIAAGGGVLNQKMVLGERVNPLSPSSKSPVQLRSLAVAVSFLKKQQEA